MALCPTCGGTGHAGELSLSKSESVLQELNKLAKAEAAGDHGPHARELAMARILTTPEGRKLYAEYVRALGASGAA